jgi:biotin synthase
MSVSQVSIALRAKSSGSSRVCMGAAWENVKTDLNLTKFLKWFARLTNLTWKFVVPPWYDHWKSSNALLKQVYTPTITILILVKNIIKKLISTRGFEDRIQTIENVRKITLQCVAVVVYRRKHWRQSWHACRAFYIKSSTESVPINALVAVEGTRMEEKTSWNLGNDTNGSHYQNHYARNSSTTISR